MSESDTVAAISTPFGTGAIAIVRMSGSKAFDIAEEIFQGPRGFKALRDRMAAYGKIIDPQTGETIDEVILLRMQGPRSFTGEDIVEINCHGGIVIQQRVLGLLLRQGARAAGPGEFTKRAFLNGRIDLAQAEAVIDIINAKTSLGSKTAAKQLEGRLSELLSISRNRLIDLLTHINATVDYPEHDLEEATREMIFGELKQIKAGLHKLLGQFEKGRILREGISVVIIGRPNVGKSSLLNRLAGRNRAIVTDIPGTTRDIIDEYISVKGIPVRAVDTAGIRQTEDRVEKIGVEKTLTELESADLVILMLDASKNVNEDERDMLARVSDRKHIIFINKTDLQSGEEMAQSLEEGEGTGKGEIIMASVANDVGIDKLEDTIAKMFLQGALDGDADILLTNARHKSLVEQALKDIEQALGAYEYGMPLDIMSIEIDAAAQSLGEITGENVSEAVLEGIFSRFCVGK